MHGSSRMPELYLYVVHGYFKAFFTRVHKFLSNKVQLEFSSTYSIDPHTNDVINIDGPHVKTYEEGDLDGKEPHPQCYCPDITKPTYQYSDSNPKPTSQMTWLDYTKPTYSSGSTTPSNSRDFQIGMDLTYCDGKRYSVTVVYEEASADILTHTISLEDGSKLQIHNRKLQLNDQTNFSDLSNTPLDYRNEVGTGLTLQDSQYLEQPYTLYLLQHELMICHHYI